ncbi:MAG: ATP-dependent RecD-like DNA helicase [Candidatus Hydrogenedentota bacterium]
MTGDNPTHRQTTIGEVTPPSEATNACIEGTIERIVYESPDSGFIVARLQEDQKPNLTTIVGVVAASPGETVRVWGRWVDDAKFGRQLKVEKYQTLVPATADAIEKYLGSGLIEGIGPTYAKRLVKSFGTETLRVIEEEPHRLRTVEGIGRKRADQIRKAWDAQRTIQSIMLFLQGHGIGVAQAVRIYKRYGDAAMAVLRDNPYRLAQDIAGIAFRSADAIAERLGIAKDSPKRAAAGLHYVMQQAASEGNVYASRTDLIKKAADLLEVEALRVEEAIPEAELQALLIREQDDYFLPALHTAEVGVAKGLKCVLSVPMEAVPIQLDNALKWVEQQFSIELSPEQRDAVRTAISAKIMVITGGPGTGKTTVLRSLLAIFDKKNISAMLAAPTGRAARRMSEATDREAKTIHRLLEFSPKQGGFTRHEGNPLNTDLVVLDECSMIDVALMHALLRALPPACRLVLVGDVDQLPSVGPGNVLLDVIASGIVPVVRLQTVFRQAGESGIISNAHRINRGLEPEFNDRDFFFIERTDPKKLLDTVVEIATERLPKRFNLDPVRDIQVLSPMHRGDAGVGQLNETMQRVLNPNLQPIGRRLFGLGDKVMQTRNNYELDVYNGDVGIVSLVDEPTKEAHIQFDDREVLYPFDDLDELTLAYACTVHKSQGSEYPAVIIPLSTQHFLMLQRNVLYTAITRASRIVVLIGDPKALRMAVRNTDVARRNTRLAERLRNVEGP